MYAVLVFRAISAASSQADCSMKMVLVFALKLSFRSKSITLGPTSGVKGASKRRLEVINALNVFVPITSFVPSVSVIVVGYTFLYFVSSGGIDVHIDTPFFVRNDPKFFFDRTPRHKLQAVLLQ